MCVQRMSVWKYGALRQLQVTAWYVEGRGVLWSRKRLAGVVAEVRCPHKGVGSYIDSNYGLQFRKISSDFWKMDQRS